MVSRKCMHTIVSWIFPRKLAILDTLTICEQIDLGGCFESTTQKFSIVSHLSAEENALTPQAAMENRNLRFLAN